MIRRFAWTQRRWDAALVGVAALNVLYISRAAAGRHDWSVAWYSVPVPVWWLVPSRLLLAAMCLLPRRRWADVVAAVLSGHALISFLFYHLVPPDSPVYFSWLATPTLQSSLALTVLVVVAIRTARRLEPGLPLTAFKATMAGVVAVGLIGYGSDIVSRPSAEREVAAHVFRQLPQGRRNIWVLDWRSFVRFQEVGAQVSCPAELSWCGAVRPSPVTDPAAWTQVSVHLTTFPGPFLVEVGYLQPQTPPMEYRTSRALLVGLFGSTVLLWPDSNLMHRAYPYLLPW